ncbi:hypothetical protein U1Q18_049960 [Sarracenia purpurea var. burkii]
MRLSGCSYCRKAFSDEFRLNRHVNTVHSNPANDMSSTPSKTKKRIKRLKMKKKSRTVPSKTKKRIKQLKTKQIYRTEIVYDNKFSCSYCPKFLSSSNGKILHERMHTGERNLYCKLCSASFLREYTFAKHKLVCQRLGSAAWCKFCDFYTFARVNLERHYRNMHGFQFKSNIEKDFLNKEIYCESTSDDNVVQKDGGSGVLENNDNEPSEYETKISQLNCNLEEIFRDQTLVPDSNSFEGTAPEKSIKPSKSNESSMRLVEILQSDDEVEEIVRDDDFELNAKRVEGVSAESPKNKSIEDHELPERQSEILLTNDQVEEMVLDDGLKSNSNRVELPSSSIESFEGKEGNEFPKSVTEIPKSNVIIQDDILESYSERFDDAMLHDNMIIKVSKSDEQSNRDVEIPQLKDPLPCMSRDSVMKSESECFENISSQKDPITGAPENNDELKYCAGSSRWDDPSLRESCEKISKSPGSDIELRYSPQNPILNQLCHRKMKKLQISSTKSE